MTILLLSVSVIAIVAPMYAEGQITVADKKTDAAGDFYLKVDPPQHKVQILKNGKSRSATYSVKVTAVPDFRDEVELSVTGLPETCETWFNPEEGKPKPSFVSVLKVIVPPCAPPGTYTLTISGASGETVHYATTTLIIEGEAATVTTTTSTTTSQTTSVRTTGKLKVSVTTDQESYLAGEDVAISGYVRLGSGVSAAGASVSLSVSEPDGDEVDGADLQTNDDGRFAENFTLSSTAANGTYTVYATASMSGYKDAFATVTFTVGLSNLPSVHIVEASITMPNGTLSSEFSPGETVVVCAVVNNTGADLVEGNTWVEALDPNNSPISLVIVMVTIHTGEQVKVGVHVILATDAKIGTYTVRILVSDRPIAEGGKFLDSKETAFLVTSETGPTTTTTTQVTSETTTSETSTTETTSQTSTAETTTETSTTETTSQTSSITSEIS
jgi:5-hydroxyisourate hydrolase-like protein (transthyretin family)